MRIEADIHPSRGDRITLVSPYTAKDLVRTIPGARWSKDDSRWSVPLAWTACLALRGVFKDDLTVGDDLSKWAWARKRDVIDPALFLREKLDAPGDDRLYDFQRAGVEFMALVKRVLLADEMGSGKTVQSILALRRLYDTGQLRGPNLIVCPNTMKRVWERELRTWWGDETVQIAVISGTAEQRRKKIRSAGDVVKENEKCLIHGARTAIPSASTTHSGSAATATSAPSASATPSTPSASARTIATGSTHTPSSTAPTVSAGTTTTPSEHDSSTGSLTSVDHSDSRPSSTSSGSPTPTGSVPSVGAQPPISTTITPPDGSEESSVEPATSSSEGSSPEGSHGSGSSEPSCTCKVSWIIINWEALRIHSRLSAFGSHALKKCVDCGGSGTVKQAQCEVHERELNEIDFAAVIADECHRAKDPNSMQTRALRAASGDTAIRFGLTGTPIANDPTELWPILNWIDSQEWPTKTAWVNRLIDFTFNIFGGMDVNGIKPLMDTEFHAGVDPHMRRMPKSVVLPFLPPIVRERRDVELGAAQKKAYEQMRDLMLAKLDSGVLMSANPMVQVGRLLQLASSYGDIIVDPATGEEHLILANPSSKLDAFMNDLPDFDGQSTIVFAESRQLIELASERLSKKSIQHGLITGRISEEARDHTIADFQDQKFQYVLCTIKAGGVGITLTQASVEAFLQRNWSPVDMDQAIARGHRIGSEIHDSITVVDYVATGTAEEAQIETLLRKKGMLEQIVRDEDMMRKFLMGEPLE